MRGAARCTARRSPFLVPLLATFLVAESLSFPLIAGALLPHLLLMDARMARTPLNLAMCKSLNLALKVVQLLLQFFAIALCNNKVTVHNVADLFLSCFLISIARVLPFILCFFSGCHLFVVCACCARGGSTLKHVRRVKTRIGILRKH